MKSLLTPIAVTISVGALRALYLTALAGSSLVAQALEYDIVNLPPNARVEPRAINAQGKVAGRFYDPAIGAYQMFVFDPSANPRLRLFAPSVFNGIDLNVVAVNDSGAMAVDLVRSAADGRRGYEVSMTDAITDIGDLNPSATPRDTRVSALNDADTIAGYSRSRGVLWNSSIGLVAPTWPPPVPSNMRPVLLNNAGDVVTYYGTGPSGSTGGYVVRVLPDGTTRQMTFSSGIGLNVWGLNDAGQVLASGPGLCKLMQPNGLVTDFISRGTRPIDCRALNRNGAFILNDSIGGNVPQIASLWTSTAGLADMGTLGGNTSASSLNNHQEAVGASTRPDGTTGAFYWSAATGMVDLQTKVSPALAGTVLTVGRLIGDDGTIVADSNMGLLLLVPRPTNAPPTAVAGIGQSIHAGSTVYLDGSASFDDNTSSAALDYEWSFVSRPVGSTAALTNANTAIPSFFADKTGTYTVGLVVTDQGGLTSAQSQVVISSANQTPTANAGADQIVVVLNTVNLSGSASTDPDGDALTYAWTIDGPAGSAAVLNGPNTATPNFQPDVPGTYTMTLTVSDFLGVGTPDTVEVTAITAAAYAEEKIMCGANLISGLRPNQVTTTGNQNALGNILSQAVKAIQTGKNSTAIPKLNEAIERTNGCEVNPGPAPDGNGSGRDWVTDCSVQPPILACLRAARDALTP